MQTQSTLNWKNNTKLLRTRRATKFVGWDIRYRGRVEGEKHDQSRLLHHQKNRHDGSRVLSLLEARARASRRQDSWAQTIRAEPCRGSWQGCTRGRFRRHG